MRLATDSVDAVVLAGGINRIRLYEGYTPSYKALLSFHGKPAIQYTLDALHDVPQIGRVCIVGSKADLREAVEGSVRGDQVYEFVPGGETMMGSIFNGLRHFASSPMVLVATADLPLLTPQAITDFLVACSQIETTHPENYFMSVVPQRCYTGDYERFTKDFNRFKDIAVCHGNLSLADPRLLDNTDAVACVNQLYNARKNPVTAAMAIGWRVGLSYVLGVHLLHRLTLDQMARIASRRFGIGLIPVILEHPEVTIDVDEPADYAFVKEQLDR